MAVLTSKDGNELIISCSCGCDESIHFRMDKDDDGELYSCLSYLSGNFYTEQTGGFFKKMKKILAIIRNKDYYYADICMTKEQFQEFKGYINKF